MPEGNGKKVLWSGGGGAKEASARGAGKPEAACLGQSRFLRPFSEYYAYAPSTVIIRSAEAELMSAVPIAHPVLDLCCGDGFFASLVYPSGVEAGCDINQPALEQAARRNLYRNLARADIAQGIPFPNACFNTVVSNSSLEHIPDIDRALSEISRILKPGGRLYATFASDYAYKWWPGRRESRQRYLGFQPVYNCFSLPEWESRMSGSGLRVMDHQYYLSRTATRVMMWADYHFSRVSITSDRTLARPAIRGMRKVPPQIWAAFWRGVFARIRVFAPEKGGGILIAAERGRIP